MKDQDLIFDYLDGAMSDAERRAFEARLQQEPELAAGLAKARQAAGALREAFRHESEKAAVKDMMQRVDEEGQGKVRPLYQRWWVAAAAAIVLLTVAAWLLSRQGGSETMPPLDQLITDTRYFDPQQAATTTMGEGDGGTFQKGYALYREGRYNEAVNEMMAVPPGTPPFAQSRLLAGAAMMADGRPDEALPFLIEAYHLEETAEYARWYLALTFLAIGDEAQARMYLQEILEQNRFKRQEAERILEKMN